MTTIKTKSHTLLIVEVEKASSEFWIDDSRLFYLWDRGESEEYINISLPEGKWKVAGTIEKDTITFDCEPYVDRFNNGACRDFTHSSFDPCDEYMPMVLTKEESFLTLLKANGIYFENDKEFPEINNQETEFEQCDKHVLQGEWHSCEAERVKGKLIVLEQITHP